MGVVCDIRVCDCVWLLFCLCFWSLCVEHTGTLPCVEVGWREGSRTSSHWRVSLRPLWIARAWEWWWCVGVSTFAWAYEGSDGNEDVIGFRETKVRVQARERELGIATEAIKGYRFKVTGTP